MTYVSKIENKALMAQAREALKGKWGLAVGALFVYQIILFACGFVPILGNIAALIITGPMILGLTVFSLALARRQEAQVGQIFDGFKRFGVALGAYLLQTLFILLWTLLLIIPGIMAALSYAMTFYIIAENEGIGAREAISRSKAMMQGSRWKLFCLGCRFIGWALLGVLTLGIGFLWIMPYMVVSYAKFYDDLKGGIDAAPAA